MTEFDVLKELDIYLSQFSYVGGYQPTQEDVKVLNFVEQSCLHQETAKYLHLSRWLRHLSTFKIESLTGLPCTMLEANSCAQRKNSTILAFVDRCAKSDVPCAPKNFKAKNVEVSRMNRCGMY